MNERDPLFHALQLADRAASRSTPLKDPRALASGAMARAKHQLHRRRLISMSVSAIIVGVATTLIVPRAIRPKLEPAIDVAALRAEVAELTTRRDRLASEIAARSASDRKNPLRAADAMARMTEMRERAAFTLVLLADRTAARSGDLDSVAAGFRRAAEDFPDSRSGAIARQRLHQPFSN